MKLSDSQRKFCQLVVDGVSHTEAYLKAYARCTTRESASAAAPRLLGNVRVKQEIERLRSEMENQRGLTREEKRKVLREIAHDKTQPANMRIQAIATDNKMMGHDEPARVQVEVGVSPLGELLKMIRSGDTELKNVTGSVVEEEMLSLPGS